MVSGVSYHDEWLEEMAKKISSIREYSEDIEDFLRRCYYEGIEVTYTDQFLKSYWYTYQEEQK